MTQTERRRFLLSRLLAEAPEYRQLAVPDDAAGQKQLLRALLNVRPPRDASPEFLQVQDEYLRAELAQKGVSTMEEYWAYWSRYIYINRYQNAPKPVYDTLFRLVQDKDYFVITTNVDHCFQKAGFAKKRLFYTQGDYGLFQCSEPCCQETFDNEALIRQMVEAQGYVLAPDGQLTVPENTILKTSVPSELVPHCPHCGKLLTMNLRCDDSFVEDAGWHAAAERYSEFLRRHEGQKILFLELGVGGNTPVIIKYPFWRMTAKNPDATYVCINKGDAVCPNEITKQSLLLDGDIATVLAQIK